MSGVSERYAASDHIQEVLRDAKNSVIRAKEAVKAKPAVSKRTVSERVAVKKVAAQKAVVKRAAAKKASEQAASAAQ